MAMGLAGKGPMRAEVQGSERSFGSVGPPFGTEGHRSLRAGVGRDM